MRQGPVQSPPSLTLYSRPGCHLCEEVADRLERLRHRYPHSLRVVDITLDPTLLERYGERIPVLALAPFDGGDRGEEYDAPAVLLAAVLERALLRAAGRAAS